MGRLTGGNYDLTTYDKLPRLSMVMMSRSYPNKVDAKLTVMQLSANASGRALQRLPYNPLSEGPSVKEVEHLAFKYLISMDGRCVSLVTAGVDYGI